MHLRYNGPGRRRTVVRRGAPSPPRRKKRRTARPLTSAYLRNVPGHGFEGFLPPSSSEPAFSELLSSAGAAVADSIHLEPRTAARQRRGGFFISVTFHLFVALLLIFEPELMSPTGEQPSGLEPEHKRLVLFMEEPKPEIPMVPVPGPEALLLMEEPPRDRLVIPKATRPPPPEKRQEFQNDLPFSEGNTDEFVTDKELDDPGKAGEPGELVPEESAKAQDAAGSGDEVSVGRGEPGEPSALADLLPKDPDFRFFDPDARRAPNRARGAPSRSPESSPRARGEGGERGDDGPFEDIRRFLQDKRFNNPEGGLVTGLGSSLYYDDKGANFVPWIRRMLAEVRRNFMMPYSASFLAGHVAVGVSVLRTGDLTDLKIIIPSGTAGFDNAAVGSLRAADLLPLPADYPDDRFDFILVFWINEQPYEIF